MTANLFSRDWYRIAELRPELRKHVRIHTHRYRGNRWYVLEDPITGQNRRLSPEAYWIIGLMNGRRTVDELWTLSSERLGETMPTHEELIQLISGLYQGNVICFQSSGDISELFEREYEARKKKLLGKLKSPLSIQIPLVDPEKFLRKTERYVAPVFSKAAALIWIGMVIFLLVAAVQYWQPLTSGISDRVLAAENLLLIWVIYPIIKLLHEFGHGYAVKRHGGEVHEMGVMLLVMMPVPYVDATASGAFRSKYHRMLVGAAGMIVEVFIAALAMLVWVNAEPGLIKSIAYNTLFIAGVSTVLVNGNPLLRFDGYYVLADFLEIPNLSQKANQAWGWIVKRFCFGIESLERPGESGREFAWLACYGIASLIYRLFLTLTIVLFVAGKYFFIGIVLAMWSFIGVWLWPAITTVRKAWSDSDIRREGREPVLVVSIAAVALIVLLAVIPFPLSTSVQGVVQFSEDQRVLMEEACFAEQVLPHGSAVQPGDVLIRCRNPDLSTRVEVIGHQLEEARARRFGVWDEPVRLKLISEEVSRLEQELEETRARILNLTLRAPVAGVWWVRTPEDVPGRHYSRGDLLGHIAVPGTVRARAMIPEKDESLVRNDSDRVFVLSAATDWREKPVSRWEMFPSATRDIPHESLTPTGGGPMVPDPSADRPQSLEPYFAVDLYWSGDLDALVNQRVFVKFQHQAEPLIFRIYRIVRRTFLEYFDV